MQKILGYMRKAIDNYNMISDGDKIAVGLSGGKDSITMLMGLKNLQRFYPKKFDIIAISINPGFTNFDTNLLKNICNNLKVPLIIEDGHIKEIVFDIRNEKNPCSLCANLRRGMLNSIAIREGCNKIAVGHNEDDVLETFIMNLFYAGSINTFAPISYMDKSKITLIRPLIYAPEKYIRSFVKKNNISIMEKNCPMDGISKREDIKELLKNLQTDIPHIRANLYGAIKRKEINGFKEFK
ncbi:MAG: tRNA 2-thiocytidine biosynthesis protein TtcA [Clostridiales bacterium]|nr:tRNA 2-thiocytidine biosynthesis protein TtcA [Clostridiales bacterium]